MINEKPSMLKIILFSIINGIAAMIVASVVVIPLLFLVSFAFTWDLSETTNTILDKLDIIAVIFIIVTIFEIIDRIFRGIKKSKILTVIRDKADRW